MYWLACGYGMRMGRALAWLTVLAGVTVAALMWWTTPSSPRRPVSHRPVTSVNVLRGSRGGRPRDMSGMPLW
jgi:hypothetical protein